MEKSFEIGNKKFKLSKIHAFKQFHIVRRLSPVLADLLPGIKSVAKSKPDAKMSEEEQLDQMAKLVGPFMTGISKLSEADADKVLYGLLSGVEMQQESGNWAFIANDAGLMFDNLELPVLLQAAGRSFMYNMAGFFAVLPQASRGAK